MYRELPVQRIDLVIAGDVTSEPLIVMGRIVPRLLLLLLDLSPDGFGCIAARDLAARCRRRLWPEFRDDGERHALRALLRLAERAGDGDVLYC